MQARLLWPQEALMSTVTTRDLKDRLSWYLRKAEAGEHVVVLRGGHPVATIIPFDPSASEGPEEILARLAASGRVQLPSKGVRASHTPPVVPTEGIMASTMVVEGRR
jgi:antitoxin (DNA-binding transcriptional repressor) of toxin-antitoxin stability system